MTDPEPAILEHADKRYGDVVAVKDLSLTLHAGQVAVLLGPNGAGKTTTLSMLVGLRRPTAGTATLFGLDPRDERARWRTGVMLQDSGVHATLTVGELIRMFSALYPRPLPFEQVVALATLKDLVGRKAGGLSGGQRQRLYFALAVCGDPDLIFLDEPTVAMDVESRAAFLKEIRALVERGKAIVMTTHYLREAEQVADRVVVIHRGTLVMDGSTSEVSALATGKWVSFRTSDPLVGSIPFLGLGMAIGYLAGPNSAAPVASLLYLLLSFTSGLFMPLSQLPEAIRAIARYLPTYHYAELAWGALGAADESVTVSLIWLAAFTVLFFGAAVRFYRRDQANRFG